MSSESGAGAPQDRPQLISALVSIQAARTPAAVAVMDGDRGVDYATLEARANQLAHHLVARGVGPETPVGVCLFRSVDLVVALLAVWRAGGAYVPLPPDLPPQRIALLIRGTGTGLVLTETETSGVVRGAGAVPLVLDAAGDDLAELPATPPAGPAFADSAAAVLHTSGTTGEPKAVVLHHGGLANRISWMVDGFALDGTDRVLQHTPIGFDAHCWEVFAPLVSGGAVVLAPQEADSDPAELLRTVAEQRVTAFQATPSLLRRLVADGGLTRCEDLRLLFSAGEPLHGELVQRVVTQAPVDLWNTYGPTECSVDVTAFQADPAQWTGPVPIGHPISGQRAVVVGRDGLPVGPGATGELLIGGSAVGRGYLGRPGATAAAFVPDPTATDGSRLYRTGDLVRQLADGSLEFLGRIDDQVKIDGVRIEPAEIEQALLTHPQVTAAAVRAYDAADGAKRLAAYVVTATGPGTDTYTAGPDPAELREFLAGILPSALLPASFMLLEALPPGPDGTVDRRALPAPGTLDADGRPVFRAPLTSTEQAVAEAWAEVLGVAPVGLDDEFFRLGGSSLQLTRMLSALRRSSGKNVQLNGFLQTPTVAAHAELLAALPVG